MSENISRRKFLKGFAASAAAMGVSSMIAGLGGSAFADDAKDTDVLPEGTYQGVGNGKGGEITVEVVFDKDEHGDFIRYIDVVKHNETLGISDLALTEMPKRILKHQSLDVDVVTGATLTSFGILNGVRDCIKQAGYEGVVSGSPEVSQSASRVMDADVVVVGAGGAGLAAAYSAAESGANVLVLETQPTCGGSTKLNGGNMVQVATPEEQETYGALNADQLFELFCEYGSVESKYFDKAVVRDYVDHIEETTEWLRKLGYNPRRYNFSGPATLKGESVNIMLVGPAAMDWSAPSPHHEECAGWRTINALQGNCEAAGVHILNSTSATSLVTDADGTITAVTAVSRDSTKEVNYTINTRAVILCSGGFGSNADLRKEYWGGLFYGGTSTDDGSGMFMAADAGALVDYMESLEDETGAGARLSSHGGVVVNSEGHVLNTEMKPMPNLFAAGEIANMTYEGTSYMSHGMCNMWNAYMGRIAGAQAALISKQ